MGRPCTSRWNETIRRTQLIAEDTQRKFAPIALNGFAGFVIVSGAPRAPLSSQKSLIDARMSLRRRRTRALSTRAGVTARISVIGCGVRASPSDATARAV